MAEMELDGARGDKVIVKKRWMLRNFGGSTEIMVYMDKKRCAGAAVEAYP